MIKVVNLYHEKYDVYIGRVTGKFKYGYFGNPHFCNGYCFICKKEHTREECLKEYKLYFDKRIEEDLDFKLNILALDECILGCYCKPQNCHGDVIKDYVFYNRNDTIEDRIKNYKSRYKTFDDERFYKWFKHHTEEWKVKMLSTKTVQDMNQQRRKSQSMYNWANSQD